MIAVSHPTGNSFVRALLHALERAGHDYVFHTTIVHHPASRWATLLSPALRAELSRRSFDIPAWRARSRPARELGRLCLSRLLGPAFVENHLRPVSVDAIYHDLDRHVARQLQCAPAKVQAIHAYEDGARESFQAARQAGIRCCYHLPIAYWHTSTTLLQQEAERWPDWRPTLGSQDSPAKLERKTEELTLADTVFCPSRFVQRSLPETVLGRIPCPVVEFGSPPPAAPGHNLPAARPETGPLRVLFAGSMSQRKGLADLFRAVDLLDRSDVELVVLGTPILPLSFYKQRCRRFRHETPRPHAQVLALMRQCDLLVLPSIVEGRALVLQEALSCGLPLLITPNTGGEDLIEPARTGFLVPIRSPDQLAQGLDWFATHRSVLPEMRRWARAKAAQLTWAAYGERVLAAAGGLPMENETPLAVCN